MTNAIPVFSLVMFFISWFIYRMVDDYEVRSICAGVGMLSALALVFSVIWLIARH